MKIATRISTPIPDAALRALEDEILRTIAARATSDPRISRDPRLSSASDFATRPASTTSPLISR